MAETYHIPALLPEALEALAIRPDGIYVDVILGGGGHSSAIIERLGSDGRLISFDQDSDAIERAMEGPLGRDSRFTPVHANFRFLSNFMRYHGVDGHVDGLLGDLGVSFHHFDDASGASLMPSPTMATGPYFCSSRMTVSLPPGSTPATTSSTPASLPTLSASTANCVRRAGLPTP